MTPTSDDPAKRQRQLDNLLPGQRAGNLVPGAGQAARAADTLRHGAHSQALVANVEAEVAELMDALADAAPVRASDGGLPRHDVIKIERLARDLRRYRAVEAWLDLHGILDEKTGEPKPAANLSDQLAKRLDRGLERMGMDPLARAKLGVDIARAVDLASLMSAQTEAERAAGGVDADPDLDDDVEVPS